MLSISIKIASRVSLSTAVTLGVICYDRWVLSEGQNNYFKDWCLVNSVYLSIFNLFKLDELWPYYQKHVNRIVLKDATL